MVPEVCCGCSQRYVIKIANNRLHNPFYECQVVLCLLLDSDNRCSPSNLKFKLNKTPKKLKKILKFNLFTCPQLQASLNLLLSMSCGSMPGKLIVIPDGATAISNLRTVRRQIPTRTKNPWTVLPSTAIGGCSTLGKKLKQNDV